MQLRLPPEKLKKLRELLVARWRTRKSCTKKELQSLVGHLNHAGKVIRPGRRFQRGGGECLGCSLSSTDEIT